MPETNWQPRWIVDIGHGCKKGITTDDGCFLVLVPNPNGNGQWYIGEWIPVAVAKQLGEFALSNAMSYK